MDHTKIELAKEYATKKFEEISKKNHFLDVFQILRDEFEVQDETVLIAGLLHDTLEDTSATYEEITENFSREVADMVQEVSHPKNYNEQQKLKYYEGIKTISNGGKLIKMADFTSHMRNFIKIYARNEQHLFPKFVNNDKYITSIRTFLEHCEGLAGKDQLYDLTKKLESYF